MSCRRPDRARQIALPAGLPTRLANGLATRTRTQTAASAAAAIGVAWISKLRWSDPDSPASRTTGVDRQLDRGQTGLAHVTAGTAAELPLPVRQGRVSHAATDASAPFLIGHSTTGRVTAPSRSPYLQVSGLKRFSGGPQPVEVAEVKQNEQLITHPSTPNQVRWFSDLSPSMSCQQI